ncbi:MAG: hypothetical protein ACWGSQ_16855, partial [Longimicrobiales bacterium]
MDELIIRVLNGEASAFEAERLSRWKNESSENAAYYREMVQVWALTAPEPQAVVSLPPDAQEIIRATDAESSRGPRGQESPRALMRGPDEGSRPQPDKASRGIQRKSPR